MFITTNITILIFFYNYIYNYIFFFIYLINSILNTILILNGYTNGIFFSIDTFTARSITITINKI